MKIYEIVFSPTGNTQKAADIVAEALDGEVEKIDLSEADFSGCTIESTIENTIESGAAVIAMPSFGGRAPMTAVSRLKMIKANGVKAVVIAVYGNRAQEDTLVEIADTAKECGFEVVAGIAAVAEHSIAHQYATGRPDAKDAEQLKGFAAKIAEKIASSSSAAPNIPGNRPYKKAGAGLVPTADQYCVRCGICAAKCPVGAIDKTDPTKTDKKVCINCMRCITVCPHGARSANKLLVKTVGMALKGACSINKDNELFI